MKKAFIKLLSVVLIASMIAPMIPTVTFAAEGFGVDGMSTLFRKQDQIDDLNFSAYNDGASFWSLAQHSTTGYEGASTNSLDQSSSKADTFCPMPSSAAEANSNPGYWVRLGATAYTGTTDPNQPKVQTYNGSKVLNAKYLTGSIYSYHALSKDSGYNATYSVLIPDASVTGTKDYFGMFFRGDQRDFDVGAEVDNSGLGLNYTYYYAKNNGGWFGGTGLSMYVTGEYELTLVIATSHPTNTAFLGAEEIAFHTDMKLTGEMRRFKVMDNGTDWIYIMVGDGNTWEPICSIRCNVNRAAAAERTGRLRDYGGSLVHQDNVKGGELGTFYRQITVYTSSGVMVKDCLSTLVRNYSRIAVAGQGIKNDILFKGITLDAFDVTEYKTVSANEVNTDDGIYLPITIRDFAADNIMFEYIFSELEDTIFLGGADGNDADGVEGGYVTPPLAVIATHSQNMIGRYTNQSGPNGKENETTKNTLQTSFFNIYFDMSTVSPDGDYANNTLSQTQMVSAGHGNPDGTYTFEWVKPESGDVDPYIWVRDISDAAVDKEHARGITVAYKFSDGYDQYAADAEAQMCMYFYFDAGESQYEKLTPTITQCTEPGYENFRIAFFDLSKLDNANSLYHLRFDWMEFGGSQEDQYAKAANTRIDILYLAAVERVEDIGDAYGAYNGSESVNTLNTIFDIESHYSDGALYPYYTFSQKVDGDKGIMLYSGNYTPTKNQSETYYGKNVSERSGYIFLRYRAPKTVSKTKADGTVVTVNNRPTHAIYERGGGTGLYNTAYINDGQWHDILIPVSAQSNLSIITGYRFDILNVAGATVSGEFIPYEVDISAFRWIDIAQFEFFVWDIEQDRRGHLRDSLTSTNASYRYFSYSATSQNGYLHLYDYHAAGTGDDKTYGSFDVNPATMKAAQIRFRSRTPMEVTLHFLGSDNVEYTRKFYTTNFADDKWHTEVIFLNYAEKNGEKDMKNAGQIKKIWATFTPGVNEDGERYAIEIGHIAFFKDKPSAMYYNSTSQWNKNPADASENPHGFVSGTYPSHAALSFTAQSRILFGEEDTSHSEDLPGYLRFQYNVSHTWSTESAYTTKNGGADPTGGDPIKQNFRDNDYYTADDTGKGIISGSMIAQGLVENTLDENSKPIYTYETVKYVADFLRLYLQDHETTDNDVTPQFSIWYGDPEDSNGYKKYGRLEGEKSQYLADQLGLKCPIDLATLLRTYCSTPENSGTYGKAYNVAKNNYASYRQGFGIKTLQQLADNKSSNTYFDIAYFLLHNLFDEGYGEEVWQYTALKLVQGKDEEGDATYTFNGGRPNTAYEPIGETDSSGNDLGYKGVIYNRYFSDIPGNVRDGSSDTSHDNYNRFNPLGSYRNRYATEDGLWHNDAEADRKNALGMGDVTYAEISSARDTNSYNGLAFHYTMQGSAQFVYEKDLYFEFLGDDDVYLFIDDQLVLDIGGAHCASNGRIYLDSITSIDWNEDPEKVHTFEFFFMERHLGEANFAIQTNIRLSNPEIGVDKGASQGDKTLGNGDNIDGTEPVSYEFKISNTTGDKVLHHLTFDDSDIGVMLTYPADASRGIANEKTWSLNTDTNLNDIVLIYESVNGNKTYNSTNYTSSGVAGASSMSYKQFIEKILTDLGKGDIYDDNQTDPVDYNGLLPGESLTVKGITYRLTANDKSNKYFDNIVDISALYTIIPNATAPIIGVVSDKAPFIVNLAELHIYLAAGAERQFSLLDIFTDSMRVGSSTFGALKTDTSVISVKAFLSDSKKQVVAGTASNSNNSNSFVNFDRHTDYYYTANLRKTNGDSSVYLDTSTINTYIREMNEGYHTFTFSLEVIKYNDTTEEEITKIIGPFPVAMYVYDMEDKNYVLDYGLPVEIVSKETLTDEDRAKGLYYFSSDDEMYIQANEKSPAYNILGYSGSSSVNTSGIAQYNNRGDNVVYTGTYGKLDISRSEENGGPLKYTPNKFMNGADSFGIVCGITEGNENGKGEYHVTNGTHVVKAINFIPASVMYYEESNGSIIYSNGMNKGGTSKNYFQSADQTYAYGYDPDIYRDDSDVNKSEDHINFKWFGYEISCGPFIGLYGKQDVGYNFSGGTYGYLDTTGSDYNMTNECVQFTFKGTGFDIISFTNTSAAMLSVMVYKDSELVSYGVVNCTYTNGQISQVPVYSKKNLAHGEYTVKIYASRPSNKYFSTAFYLDGIRIYNPAADDAEITGSYTATEQGAKIYPIRDQILAHTADNKYYAGVATLNILSDFTTSTTLGMDGSLVERIHNKDNTWGAAGENGDLTTDYEKDVYTSYTYNKVGPNHELYLAKNTALVFKLAPENSVSGGSTVQIEARAISNTAKNTSFKYYFVESQQTSESVTVNTYTSMYYTIGNIPANGGYLVIAPENNEICFTNIKLNGYVLEPLTLTLTEINKGELPVASSIEEAMFALSGMDYMYNDKVVVESVSTPAAVEIGEDIVIKITASANAERVRILDENGEDITVAAESVRKYDDRVVITVKIKAEAAGEYKYSITAVDANNRTSPIYETKTVTVSE